MATHKERIIEIDNAGKLDLDFFKFVHHATAYRLFRKNRIDLQILKNTIQEDTQGFIHKLPKKQMDVAGSIAETYSNLLIEHGVFELDSPQEMYDKFLSSVSEESL